MLPASTEPELIERAQCGDVRAFELLIAPHVPSIRRLARAFCRNWADADDLAQEALVKAYRSLPKFRADAALSTWLYTIARSTFLDWRRSKAVRKGLLEDRLDDNQRASERLQDELLGEKLDACRLWNALARLDDKFRTVVVLYDLEGLSYEQIAQVEQVPIGTVRSRLSRGRKRLAALLEADAALGSQLSGGTSASPVSSNLPARSRPCPS